MKTRGLDHCRPWFHFNGILGNHGPEPSKRGYQYLFLGIFSHDDHRNIYLDAAILAFQDFQKARLGRNYGNENSGRKTIT